MIVRAPTGTRPRTGALAIRIETPEGATAAIAAAIGAAIGTVNGEATAATERFVAPAEPARHTTLAP